MAGKIYVAKSSALIQLGDGNNVVIKGGITRVREGHPLLDGRENMFEEIGVHYDVETTRQAPEAESKPEPAPKPEVKAEPKAAPAKKAASHPQRGPRRSGS
jgi:hypothetical protein